MTTADVEDFSTYFQKNISNTISKTIPKNISKQICPELFFACNFFPPKNKFSPKNNFATQKITPESRVPKGPTVGPEEPQRYS